MSTLKTDAIEAATGTNTDLSLDGKGTGVPDLGAGFKVGSVAGVPTASIRDDAVTTAKILDDNVTLAKLASGTDGELITWDASGDPATVAVGTATHVLTSNGAGAAPTFQAPAAGGAWNIIGTAVASASASLTITGLDSTYDSYAIAIQGCIPASDGVDAFIRLGDASGIDSGGSDYHWGTYDMCGGCNNDSSAAEMELVGGISMGSSTGEGFGAMLYMNQPGDSTIYPQIGGNWTGKDNDGTPRGGISFGQRLANITTDRVQLIMASGNIASGRMTVWGIAHA